MMKQGASLLDVQELQVRFLTPAGEVRAVNRLSLSLGAGETLGLVGESGSGKSQAVLACMGLGANNARISGSVKFRGEELIGCNTGKLNRIRGKKIAMIFQDPMTSLNPHLTVALQMIEMFTFHQGMSRHAARGKAIQMLDAVKIPSAAERIDSYPHEFSGGMRQRVMIAMALACDPELLIADEPTTALDVTVQAQILALLGELRHEFGMSIILITHDLGVVAGLCEQVLVMYAGQIMEQGTLEDIFYRPQHPYTRAMLHALPRLDAPAGAKLAAIPGAPPSLLRLGPGCPFYPRCTYRLDKCRTVHPQLRAVGPRHAKACHLERMRDNG